MNLLDLLVARAAEVELGTRDTCCQLATPSLAASKLHLHLKRLCISGVRQMVHSLSSAYSTSTHLPLPQIFSRNVCLKPLTRRPCRSLLFPFAAAFACTMPCVSMQPGHNSYPLRVYCRSSKPISSAPSGNRGLAAVGEDAEPFVTAILSELEVVLIDAVRERGCNKHALESPGAPGTGAGPHAVESLPSLSDGIDGGGTRAASRRRLSGAD